MKQLPLMLLPTYMSLLSREFEERTKKAFLPSEGSEEQFDLDFVLNHDSKIFLLISFTDSEKDEKEKIRLSR